MNSVQMGICQRQAGEAALQTHFFPTSRASQTGISVLIYKCQRKSTNQKATGSNPVGCTIKTLDELRAVEGFSFAVLKQFFLILLDFLSLTSRSASSSSISEDALRLFSLWSRSIPVVLIKMGDLAQIMAQNPTGGCRFFLVLPVFFHASLWHRPGTNRLIPP